MLKAIVVVIILGIFVLGYLMLGKWNGFLYHSYRSRQQKKKERESMLRIGFFNPMLEKYISDTLQQVLQQYPTLSVDFYSGAEEELIRELSAQKLDVIVIQNDMTPMPDIQCLSKTFRLEQQEGTPDHIRLVEAQEEDSDLLRVVWPKNQNSPVVRYFLKCLSDR